MQGRALILGERKDGKLRQVTLEATSAAKKVTSGEVVVLLLGDGSDASTKEMLGAYGADRLLTIEHEALRHYTSDAFMQALRAAVDHVQPEVIVFGHTAIGKDIAPRLAARLGAGLISDVVDIVEKDGVVHFVRPIYAGKAFEERTIEKAPMMFTIRPNNIAPLAESAGRNVQEETLALEIKDLRSMIEEVVKKATSGVDLSEAKIVVSGGRGTKGEEGFKLLYELAEVLGGAVGASRGACDAGYVDYALQIGQTGKVVTPDLYIACGISGAIQHLAGMSASKVIVAINKDPEAPIFQVADYGIVGDMFEVLPPLIEAFKKIKSA
ncbi:MAG: Electron transfer flavoprotein, alpha subunit [Candidatus Carbobacillus altaicus]|uniref:Electron transfer flavoprotein, alpha subunit n=1 Tax=Candidatus Carbonibacillus altaicus TaxID=2163959 RepID=A0A2R6Y4E9_9BACL|nr:MAG: Electron transfer flavoprotein, alpha subunit [Candidatus Carbobacillus altaicus]